MSDAMQEAPLPRTDVGLGTAYERIAIYKLFEEWLSSRPVAHACEGPVDGMAGIPGVHLVGLARRGTTVRVDHPSEEALERVRGVYAHLGVANRLETKVTRVSDAWDGGFDLALTYNALAMVADWRGYLRKTAARSSRYVLVSVTNPYSYGTGIRRLVRLAEERGRTELFDHPSCRPSEIEPELRAIGRIVEHQQLDCPWWPDLFVETGDTLLSGTLRRLPGVGRFVKAQKGGSGGFYYGPENFPLFEDHPGYGELRQAMRKHPTFDGRGALLGWLFGHHHAYLVEKH